MSGNNRQRPLFLFSCTACVTRDGNYDTGGARKEKKRSLPIINRHLKRTPAFVFVACASRSVGAAVPPSRRPVCGWKKAVICYMLYILYCFSIFYLLFYFYVYMYNVQLQYIHVRILPIYLCIYVIR